MYPEFISFLTNFRTEMLCKMFTFTHSVFKEKVNKTALNSRDHKRVQTFEGSALYPYDTSIRKVWKTIVKISKN